MCKETKFYKHNDNENKKKEDDILENSQEFVTDRCWFYHLRLNSLKIIVQDKIEISEHWKD